MALVKKVHFLWLFIAIKFKLSLVTTFMAILLKNVLGKKVDFCSCDFDIFDYSIGCATKFNGDEIFFFFLSLLDQKSE